MSPIFLIPLRSRPSVHLYYRTWYNHYGFWPCLLSVSNLGSVIRPGVRRRLVNTWFRKSEEGRITLGVRDGKPIKKHNLFCHWIRYKRTVSWTVYSSTKIGKGVRCKDSLKVKESHRMETKYQQNSFNLTVPLSESPRKTKSDRTWFRVGK